MKQPNYEKQQSYSEGNLDEGTIAYFLRHLDHYDAPKKIKHTMKVVLMELVSNILSHGENGYGSVSIKQENGCYIIKTSNYAQPEKIQRTMELSHALRSNADLRRHYLEQLSELNSEKQVSLGLIEILRLSKGATTISSSRIDGRPVIHFEITLDGEDTNS